MTPANVEAIEPRLLLTAALSPDSTFGGGQVVLRDDRLVAFGQAI